MALYLGNEFANTLTGGTADDAIMGFGGVDTLYGGNGNDDLRGGEGNDNAYGGNGNDVVEGGGGNDTVDGGLGNDILIGGVGNDFLDGGDDRDTFTGGSGNDTYDFDSTADMGISSLTRDVITSFGDVFVNDQDRIDLQTMDANAETAANDAFSATFIAANGTFTAAGQIRIVQNPADLTQRIIELNTDNDDTVEAQILVQVGGNNLDSTDFFL